MNALIDKIKKKRGRKPKVKEEIVEEKKPKKRGRKPKEKVYSVKELPKTFFEENKNETLILHLPIKPNEKMENPHPEASNNDTNCCSEDVTSVERNDANVVGGVDKFGFSSISIVIFGPIS